MQLKSIQILRGVAALGVLLYHAGRWLGPAPIVDIGAAGVDLFFVISGFIMVYTSERLFGQAGAPQQFLARRIVRIVPLYWTLTAFAALVLFGFGPNTLGSYLFIPTHRGPILTVGWTLNYEMMFYSLFAAVIVFRRRVAIATLSAILILLVITPTIFGWTLPTPWKDWTAPLLLEFVFGMAIGMMYCEGWRLRPAISCALGAAAVTTFAAVLVLGFIDGTVVFGYARPLTWGIGAALIVAAFALADVGHRVPFVLRPAEKLGDVSYALYLCHPLVLPLMTAVGMTRFIEPARQGYAFAILFFGSAIVAAIMLHRLDEAGRKRILAAFRTSKSKRHAADISVENGKTRPANLIPLSP